MSIYVLGFPVKFSGDQILPILKRQKLSTAQVVGEGKIGSWGGAQIKCEVHECELTKNMFFQSDFLQLCLKEKRKIPEFLPYNTVFYD